MGWGGERGGPRGGRGEGDMVRVGRVILAAYTAFRLMVGGGGLVCLLGEYDKESPECVIDERGRLEVLSNRRSPAVCLTQCPMMAWCFQGEHSII